MRADRSRILVLIKGLGLGGAERLIADGAAAWDRESFDYHVAYVLPWKDQLVPQLVDADVDVRCIGGKRGLDAATPFRLRDLLSDLDPEIVHAHLPSAGILARVTTGRPVVYTEHNIASSYRQPTRTLNRMTYGRNRAVIAVSDPVGASLAGFPGPEPVVVPNGISVEEVDTSSVRAEFDIDQSRPLFVHVGNIRPHKGHSNLIAAVALLRKRIPDVVVLSAGGEKFDGDLDRINGEAQAAGASQNIMFLGRREDGRRLLAAADVVVNPSDFEGLPVTLLEALLYARPVVATDVGGVAQVIRNESTGLLVPPKDPAALAEAMERAITDPAASEWGKNGKALAESEHSIETMVRHYEDIYRTVLDG